MNQSSLGAHVGDRGTTFVVFSTKAKDVRVRLFSAGADGTSPPRPTVTVPLEAKGDGRFESLVGGVGDGALYKFVLDGNEFPDPYARSLPFGVHGPARVVARHAAARPLAEPPARASWVVYELHVGTFTKEGTYQGVIDKLDHIVSLGVNVIELLPVGAFPGDRGWGYDGVALYAPYAGYGEPDDLRRLVREAHQRGLMVVLDVVYNHFGPSGNYLSCYAEEYFTKAIQTPWGAAPDFGHAPMRDLVVQNARYWFEEFGFDGLRLDATHEIRDTSKVNVLRELTDLAHAMTPPRALFFEDERNEPTVVTELHADGVWADDVHHQLHVLLTGERDGYYAAYTPTVEALAKAIRRGWMYEGAPYAPWKGKPRGKALFDTGVLPSSLVYCLQNHDQIGNRALGQRLSALVDVDVYLAASTILLFLPATPLLFMGQEWAASTPFLFFSDHEGELGDAVRKGRREEFKSFAAFADPQARDRIPDPQAATTFESSKLRWDEIGQRDHARVLETYRELLALRRSDEVLSASCRFEDLDVEVRGDVLVVARRHDGRVRRLVVNFSRGTFDLGEGARILFASNGETSRGSLAPRQAVIVDR
jgi:maltooligosyltrehalose trehalohydrolase